MLLLDEPFAAVDQVTRRKLQRELATLRHQLDVPIVFVTHDLEEAHALADRMCVVQRGRTIQEGPPLEVLTKPRSVSVANVVDLENILEGTVIEHRPDDGVTMLGWLDYVLEAPHTPEFPPGTRVNWVVPTSHVLLHRRERPSRGERENPVHGKVADIVTLGEQTTVMLLVDDRADGKLTFTVSTHAARRNALAPGVAASGIATN